VKLRFLAITLLAGAQQIEPADFLRSGSMLSSRWAGGKVPAAQGALVPALAARFRYQQRKRRLTFQ